MSDDVTFNISETAWSVISGSEISMDPLKYDGGSQGAQDAYHALTNMHSRRVGRSGRTHICSATRAGAWCIRDYCEMVGSTWAGEPDPEVRRDSRALLVVARKIESLLNA